MQDRNGEGIDYRLPEINRLPNIKAGGLSSFERLKISLIYYAVQKSYFQEESPPFREGRMSMNYDVIFQLFHSVFLKDSFFCQEIFNCS